MTRQKKEIIKKIDMIEAFIGVDRSICGYAPAGRYDPLYTEIYGLYQELAFLRKFKNVEDMFCDRFVKMERYGMFHDHNNHDDIVALG